jgi:sugar lactone lactonase YvrE
VADAGNHRVLGWHLPVDHERAADLVIGQPGFDSAVEFPYRPQGPQRFRFPYGVTSAPDGRLFVADTSNNRVLVVDDAAAPSRPRRWAAAVDVVLGQPDLDANGENRWDRVVADSFCWPYGLHWGDGLLAVADSGNNRVVIWDRP